MKIHFSVFLILLTSISLFAQIEMPNLSPKKITKQKVRLTNFTLEYGQPSKNERKIFGSLIPYNRVWRTGANASTKISIDKEVSFANHKILAGTYGLYSIPNKKESDLIRFTIPSKKMIDTQETLNIYFEKLTVDGVDLVILWKNTKTVIPVFVDSDTIIQNQINTKIINSDTDTKPQTYFDAAQFYYQKNKDLNTAFKWFTKASELRPEAFWYTYYKAELAHKLGNDKIAKKDAIKCLKAAKNSKSTDYGYIAKCSILLNKIIAKK